MNGSKGSIVFNLEKMNELEYYNASSKGDRLGFRLIQATADCHPFMGLPKGGGPRYWPVAHIIGYEHTFINTVYDLMQGIADNKPVTPSLEDGLKTQYVLDACDKAATGDMWVKVGK